MQYVRVHGAFFDISIISSAVHQKGHPSPFLIIMFINSINSYLSISKVLLFAHDINMILKSLLSLTVSNYNLILNPFNFQSPFWTQHVGLNLGKCNISSFIGNMCLLSTTLIILLSHNYGSLIKHVSCIKDLGFYLTPIISFDHHIKTTIGRTLNVLSFIKCNTTLIIFISCLSSHCFSLVRSILEYGIVV